MSMLIEERFFRQISEAATGFSPHQYVVQRRVERARVLLGVSPGAPRREDTRQRAIALSRP